ncbi:3-carboxy-cis,cis-muconate cycloisomerase [Rhodococcus rhodnii]|uniref:3-carboxy-cis,cis-muconate cycloisomerase n=2 Tax=Rhodococcus rhodnii TaxID=38312 RepID=R7WSJ2_9NOCA|nr:3-carboxy-cis,cis-muconate cycloisomerase [Rhodococcus rhodnii]EOM76944.1 3-carboxy-cis,cis-muconate cycloisomerase [Rhodococcus rhodnii LMG 5362]TXG89829.1 3-carboxy-cis,cis-muconate cycloisomerase [Rhodococcus rhodnii]
MTNTRGELFDPLFGESNVTEHLSDQAWVSALLEVEAALSRAASTVGLTDAVHAATVTQVAGRLSLPGGLDVADLGQQSKAGGNPVIPLVKTLRTAVAGHGVPSSAVHVGATSQDVMDSALMLLSARAGHRVLADLQAAADAAADLARLHRNTPMAARTLGQQALPTTFGVLAVSWFTGLDGARSQLERAVSMLPVQFGGAAGTLAAVYPHGMALADALADELALARQSVPWHTTRTPLATFAAALGVVAGSVSKPATDVVLMASTEFGEVAEDTPGGSSAMPHKQNPVAAIAARAAARRVPSLVATILSTMDHEFSRAAGAWHAEWETTTDLMRLSAGAADRLATSLGGLRVHPEVMSRNLDITGGLILAERVATALAEHTDAARDIVTAAATSGVPLDRHPAITEHLTADELRNLLDPTQYLGHATELVDRALDARTTGGHR